MEFPAKLFDEIKTAFTASFIGSFVGEQSGESTNWVIQAASAAETIKVLLSIFDGFSSSLHYSCSTSLLFRGKKGTFFFDPCDRGTSIVSGCEGSPAFAILSTARVQRAIVSLQNTGIQSLLWNLPDGAGDNVDRPRGAFLRSRYYTELEYIKRP